jgi:hypothetical protein
MTPTNLHWVFFVRVLGIGDQQIGVSCKINGHARHDAERVGVARTDLGVLEYQVELVVRRIHDALAMGLHAVRKTATRMGLLQAMQPNAVDVTVTIGKVLGNDSTAEVGKRHGEVL